MFSRLREHFGTAGLVVAIVALVAALAGGAVAANGGGSGSSDGKATASAKKGPRGPRGPQGPKGDTGPQGPAGPAGAKGDTGAAGANGKDGAKGDTGAAGAKGATGPEGPEGPEGSPWTAGGTLPSGETETGSWKAGPLPSGTEVADFTAISFPIPLAQGVSDGMAKTVVPESGPVPVQCDDGVAPPPSPKNPEADPGDLCVFTGMNPGAPAAKVGGVLKSAEVFAEGVSPSGAIVLYGTEGSAPGAFAWGTWAVTAP